MIWYYLLVGIGTILSFLFSWLPNVEELPLGMDTAILTATTYFRSFMEIFPPFQVVLTAFLWYIAFKFSMIILNLFLGHRTPKH